MLELFDVVAGTDSDFERAALIVARTPWGAGGGSGGDSQRKPSMTLGADFCDVRDLLLLLPVVRTRWGAGGGGGADSKRKPPMPFAATGADCCDVRDLLLLLPDEEVL